MSFYEWVGAVTAVISFFSIIGNVMQYVRRREESSDMRKMAQEHYNNYYYISRALTRVRNRDEKLPAEDAVHEYEKECGYISGIADSARGSLIDFARESLHCTLQFEHPAFPGKTDFSFDVKMGLPPEHEKKVQEEYSPKDTQET